MKCYIESFHIILKQNNFYNTFTVPCERSKVISFAFSIIKNIIVFPAQSRPPIKLIYCTAFLSASSALGLLKSFASNL